VEVGTAGVVTPVELLDRGDAHLGGGGPGGGGFGDCLP
jgi:hypothetical protein